MSWTPSDAEALRDKIAPLATAFPGVTREDSHGHTGFLLRGKRIAWFLVDHHGDGRVAVWLKAPAGEQQALIGTDPVRYFVPPYLGPSGWVGVDLAAAEPDWDELHGLLEQAWRLGATKKAIREYDAQG